jgi:biopolymer transport protein ExbB/TolQ
VPVTARLSQRFYEKFGDELAQELVDWFNDVDATYRADLRELNELNFARFDAKVEQRFAQAESRFERRLGALKFDLIKWMFVFWTSSAVANLLLRR